MSVYLQSLEIFMFDLHDNTIAPTIQQINYWMQNKTLSEGDVQFPRNVLYINKLKPKVAVESKVSQRKV